MGEERDEKKKRVKRSLRLRCSDSPAPFFRSLSPASSSKKLDVDLPARHSPGPAHGPPRPPVVRARRGRRRCVRRERERSFPAVRACFVRSVFGRSRERPPPSGGTARSPILRTPAIAGHMSCLSPAVRGSKSPPPPSSPHFAPCRSVAKRGAGVAILRTRSPPTPSLSTHSHHRQARRPQDRGDDAQVLGAVREAVRVDEGEKRRGLGPRRGGREKTPLRFLSHDFISRTNSTDTFFCVDKSVTAVVIQGLAEHKEELGAPLCPCR